MSINEYTKIAVMAKNYHYIIIRVPTTSETKLIGSIIIIVGTANWRCHTSTMLFNTYNSTIGVALHVLYVACFSSLGSMKRTHSEEVNNGYTYTAS